MAIYPPVWFLDWPFFDAMLYRELGQLGQFGEFVFPSDKCSYIPFFTNWKGTICWTKS